MSDFVHLHLHSQYSLLDGANRIADVAAAAKDAGMPALALTDHGNMFGAIDFYRQARRAGVKPILGIEAYVAYGDRKERGPRGSGNNHLVLLAQSETGLRNLIKLTSQSFLEGFYYRPRIDKSLLRRHSEGLIGLSACLKGEINEKILAGQAEQAESSAVEFREILGDDGFYLELQDHTIPEQRQANEVLRAISRRTGIPLVATNDCHYLHRDDATAHDVLLCIGTQKTLSDPDRLRYASDQFYLKSGAEMAALFPHDRQALENTLAIAERCHLELETDSFHLPEFPVPGGYSVDEYFDRVVGEGLEGRLAELERHNADVLERFSPEIYRQRLATEVEVIKRMEFAGYFLIVWDFIRQARETGIPVGPGRGSAAGSLVAYALRITDIDPLQYGLLFERFLNPERVSLPDIDIDFCMRRRGEVIQYVNEKYGRDRVAQIITFGTLAAKAVIRDVGRVLGIPYAKVDRIAKLLPEMTRSLKDAADSVGALQAEISTDPQIQEMVEIGCRLEGLTRHASLHAAGVVIAPRPIDELVPLYKTSKDEVVTQWDKDVIEDLGLLKMDFLGLRTLTVIDDTLRLLRHQGVELDLDRIPLDDEESFRLFSDGRTNGIFQFESSGMKDLLRRARPSRFEDLAAFNALYRPGALSVGMVEDYIQRKLGKRKVSYVLPQVRPILEETLGVIVYQEQVMQIAVEVSGFSMGEADVLRKAMGKKSPKVMAEQKQKFLQGAKGRGVAPAKARRLWEYIEPFAGYGFNKSHSVAYALLAYKTAYLKAHHPVAFMAAMLSSEMGSKDNVAKYIQECRAMGISVLPPDVNESSYSFTVGGESIRFGLGAVKGVGETAVESILEARRRVGRFRSLTHFATEVDLRALNHKVFESLIKSGSFDGFGFERSALYQDLDTILDYAQNRQREVAAGQGTLFSAEAVPEPQPQESTPPWPDRRRLTYEKEALGFYLTGHPLSEHRERLERQASHTTGALDPGLEGPITIGGVVTRPLRTKIKSGPNAGRLMGRFGLEDLEGSVPVAVFADTFERYGHLLEEGAIVLIKASVRERGSHVELGVEEVTPLDEVNRQAVTSVAVELPPGLAPADLLRLRDVITENPGSTPVTLHLRLGDGPICIRPPERFRVRYDESLAQSIEEIVGQGRVRPLEATPAA
jgi:DNA polymerase-3 subunit alpha